MLSQNILAQDLTANRQKISSYLKKCRETYMLTAKDIEGQTGLCQKTIYQMESGTRAWNIDSQILYLLAVIALAKQKKYFEHRAKAFPECNEAAMRNFLNQHK